MASSRSLGSLTLDLIAKIGGFEQGMDRAARIAQKNSRLIEDSVGRVKKIIATGLGGIAIAGIADNINDAIQLGDEMGKLADKARLTGSAASELSTIFRKNDLDNQTLITSMRNMQIALANGEDGFKKIGLNIDELRSKNSDQAFMDIAEAISNMADENKQAAAAQEIFKKTGYDILPVLKLGKEGIQALRKELGGLSDENIRDLQAADDAIKQLEFLKQSFWNRAAIGVTQLATAMGLIDLSASDKLIQDMDELVKNRDAAQAAVDSQGSAGEFSRWWYGSEGERSLALAQKRLDEFNAQLRAKNAEYQKLNAGLGTGAGDGGLEDDDNTAERMDGLSEVTVTAGKAKTAYDQLIESQIAEFQTQIKSRDAIASAKQSMDEMVASLQQQVATYGLSEEAVIEYRLTQGDLAGQLNLTGDAAEKYKNLLIELTKASAEAAKATQYEQDLLQDAAAIYDATRTPMERMIANMKRLDELRSTQGKDGQPLVDDETAGRATDAMQENNYDELLRDLGIYVEDVVLSYEQMNAAIDEQLSLGLISEKRASEARVALGKAEQMARLNAAQQLFGGLSNLMSTGSKKSFEVGKAAAIAEATVSASKTIIKAFDAPTWWQGVAQGASAAALLYSQIDQLKNIQFNGYQQGGYTGNGGVGDIAGVVHGREFVFDAAATARYGIGNLEALRRGEGMMGSNITVENHGTPKTYERTQGITPDEVRYIARDVVATDTPRLFASQMGDANSTIAKSITNNTHAARRR